MSARFTHTVPDDLNERIDVIAEQKGMTKTAFINMIMADYVGAYEDPGFYNEMRKRIKVIEEDVAYLKVVTTALDEQVEAHKFALLLINIWCLGKQLGIMGSLQADQNRRIYFQKCSFGTNCSKSQLA